MRTGKWLLFCAFIIAALYCSVVYGAETPQITGQPGQALADIRELNVSIEYPDSEPNIANLPWREIQSKVEKRLKGAGLKIASEHYQEIKSTALEIPELIISVEAYRLDDSKRYALHIQTFLSRAVYLAKERRQVAKADVWRSTPVMQLIPIRFVSGMIPSLVMGQMDAFIIAYFQANPAGGSAADANDNGSDTLKTAKERAKPAAEQPPVRYEYVASKNSKVFHKADCASAKRISPENLVGYNSRDEAIKAGKRPCERCKP